MKRLSIVALALLSGCGPQGQAVTATIPRPAPDEATPTGIAYLCDGSKEVSVVYAKNRASVTMAPEASEMVPLRVARVSCAASVSGIINSRQSEHLERFIFP